MRLIRLRYEATCVTCAAHVAAGMQAWWSGETKQVICMQCRSSPAAKPSTFEAGRSAQRAADKRTAAERKERDEAGLLKRVFWRNEPSRARNWARGAEGERTVGALLDKLQDEGVIVALHDIRIPRTSANVDHVAIARSGVHIIDAKYYKGAQIEIVDRGGLLRRDVRLQVAKRNRTPLVSKLAKQILTVDAQLRDTPLPTPVTPVLCFVGALWGFFKKEYELDGVRIVPPPRLEGLLRRPGPLTGADIELVGTRLRERLHPA